MTAAITYKYRCPCCHVSSKTDNLNAIGAYIRLILEPAISCPRCHRLLQATINIEYSSHITLEEQEAIENDDLQVL